MEDEVNCNDPQFMNMLETFLRMEIEEANNTIAGLVDDIKEYKVKVQRQLKVRKELKEKTQNAQENILVLTATLNKHNKYISEISDKIELMKFNLDSDYKVMKLEYEQHKNIYDKYEKTWKLYHARYEEFPLAKVRKEAKIKLEKMRVDRMVLDFKINELEKIFRQKQRITWIRMRGKIVLLARAILDNMKLDDELKHLNKSINDRKEELNVVNAELAVQLKRKEEEKRARALKLLEMPPPKIHFSHMRTIYGRRSRVGFADRWDRNYENTIDSLSVDTLVLEEMCEAEENSVQDSADASPPTQEDQNLPYNRAIDRTSPSLYQEEQEVEHEDAVSEVNGNAASRPIDVVEEEVEHSMEHPQLEHLDQSSEPVSKDKQTAGHVAEDPAAEIDDPAAKRMRWMNPEQEKLVPSPIRNIRVSERAKGHSVDPSTRPKITKIETVRCNVSFTKNTEQGNAPYSGGSRASPAPRITKMPSMTRKPDQDNPNPSSMFTPRHYDFSGSSEMSFCVDNSMADLKEDQISLFEGSVRDLCECSIVSPNEEAEIEADSENNAASARKAQNFPQFDFSSILKRRSNQNNLF